MPIVELGKAAVLDPENMRVGQYVVTDTDLVVRVTQIVGERVDLIPVVGFELMWYRRKGTIITCLCILLFILSVVAFETLKG